MTNPIPGADAERAAFEVYAQKSCRPGYTLRRSISGDYVDNRVASKWATWQAARAAAKVGANAAAESIGDDERFLVLVRRWLALKATKCGSEAIAEAFKQVVGHIDARLDAGAPAETPKPSQVQIDIAYAAFSQVPIGAAQPTPAPRSGADVEKDAWRDVLAERKRQISAEGWTPGHDDKYAKGELPAAAACYATEGQRLAKKPPPQWPWGSIWWKPAGNRRNLVKAGALILAEIERLDRAAMLAASSPTTTEKK